jgi:hypothetical protein
MEKLRQWQKVHEIVGAALGRQPAERGAYLDEVCSQDTELRAEVESLLFASQFRIPNHRPLSTGAPGLLPTWTRKKASCCFTPAPTRSIRPGTSCLCATTNWSAEPNKQ